jgi:hypothetical protein
MAYIEVYDYNLLDDIHNLFPEFLYDNAMFPSDTNSMIGWIRFRTSDLFPQIYRRERIAYDQLRAVAQRERYDDWLFMMNRPSIFSPPPLRMPPQPIRMSTYDPSIWNSPTINNLIRSPSVVPGWGGAYTTPPRQPNFMISPSMQTGLSALFNTFYDPVPVSATDHEILAASTLMPHNAISAETICPICQDNDQVTSPDASGGSPPITWRKLNQCGHLFHTTCVDNWFARNVHCPVCRADIRGSNETGMQA